MITAELETIE